MIEIGQITLSDLFLTLLGVVLGGGGLWWLFKKVVWNQNTLKDNEAGGDIAGGSILQHQTESKAHSENRNVLKRNKAGGDIAGGDIEK